jgi:hypothetical protein
MNDDRLRRLLSDAVSDIEPEDRIEELRARVHPSPKVVPMARPRSWYAAAGIVTTAAVIGVIAYLTSTLGNHATGLGPADGGTTLPSATTAVDPSGVPSSGSHLENQAVYYLGHGPRGMVLYRETTPVAPGLAPLQAAVSALMTAPYDPDYRLGWSPGWLESAQLRDGVVQVELGPVPSRRPSEMSRRTAYEVVQSAVYTLQAATRSPTSVQFLRSGDVARSVLGVRTDRLVAAGRPGDVLSHVGLTRPAVDDEHSRQGRLVVAGTCEESLGTIVVRLVRTGHSGEHAVLRQSVLAGGAADANHRFRWRAVFDTSSLRGSYTIVARNAGPHGDTDTRVVIVR